MGQLAHPLFDGSNLAPPLAPLVDTAADLAEALARKNPNHELLDLFVDISSDHEAVLEGFQIRFSRPGAKWTERFTVEGQVYFWQRYIEALDAAFREDEGVAADTYSELLIRIRS